MDNLAIATPEIFMLVATCVVLVVSLFIRQDDQTTIYWASQATLLVTLLMSFSQIGDEAVTGFSGAYGLDPMSTVLKSWILVVTIGGFLYSRDYINEREIARGEYYVLGCLALWA